MELKDTLELMFSENYKERFKAEYYQVVIRHNKLYDMLIKYEAETLEFKPHCTIEILQQQLEAMDKYLRCLEIRAEMEKIELDY